VSGSDSRLPSHSSVTPKAPTSVRAGCLEPAPVLRAARRDRQRRAGGCAGATRHADPAADMGAEHGEEAPVGFSIDEE
jgi:transcription initiation factor TFIID subunit TAF12